MASTRESGEAKVPASVAAALAEDEALREHELGMERPWSCPIFSVERHEVRTAEGDRGLRFIARHNGGVGVVAVRDGRVCLVRQWRLALGRVTLEIPAGRLEAGEGAAAAASRELAEETGLSAGSLAPLVTVYGSPGFTSERTQVFLARDLAQGVARPDEGEVVRVVWLPAADVLEAVLAGAIQDGKTVSGVLAAHAAGVLE